MSDDMEELARRLVVRRKSDGRSVYDEVAKAELVAACGRPGASVSRLARESGINANQLSRWIREHSQRRQRAVAVCPPPGQAFVAVPMPMVTGASPAVGRMRVHAAPGTLALSYAVTVDLMHLRSDPAQLEEMPAGLLPSEVLGYRYPSRYCQSDRLLTLASNTFGMLQPGYGRVRAIRDWVNGHVKFTSHSSNSNTSALDTLIDRVGVCRDFAHLMIALCRAMNIPARYATGTDYGSDPTLGPPTCRPMSRCTWGQLVYLRSVRHRDPDGILALRHRA